MTYHININKVLKVVGGAALRGRFNGVLGLIRYFLCRPATNDPRDSSILELLIYECDLNLDSKTLNRLLRREKTILQFHDGFRFLVEDLEDFYHASMCYEPRTLAFIQRSLRNGGIFVDVGANIGGYTVRVAKRSRVYALEPHPRNFHFLKFNLKLNQEVANARIFQVAAGPYIGRATLHISDYHGRHSLLYSQNKMKYSITVDMITLDSLLTNEKSIDVIKIDVEGAEILVLEGARETLKKTKFVIIETLTHLSFHHVRNILAKYHFRPVKKLDNNIVFTK